MNKVYFSKTVSFGTLPIAMLTDLRLGPPAFRLAFWFASRPNGWQPWRTHIMRELGMGVEMWQNACKQLEAAGYLIRHGQHNHGGKFGGMRIEFNPIPDGQNPTLAAANTVTGLPAHGSSVTGSPVSGSPVHLTPKTEQIKTKEPPPPPSLVVVVSESLIFPDGIGDGIAEVLTKILQPISNYEKKQELLDELAGCIAKGTVKSPAGLLRKLASLQSEGKLICEMAPIIKHKRIQTLRKVEKVSAASTSGTSPAALLAREKLKEMKQAYRSK